MTTPAPESSTPKCPNCGKPKNAPDPFGCEAVFHWSDEQLAKVQQRATPVSYFEVVERLAECAGTAQPLGGFPYVVFNRERATEILDEWREQIRKGE